MWQTLASVYENATLTEKMDVYSMQDSVTNSVHAAVTNDYERLMEEMTLLKIKEKVLKEINKLQTLIQLKQPRMKERNLDFLNITLEYSSISYIICSTAKSRERCVCFVWNKLLEG